MMTASRRHVIAERKACKRARIFLRSIEYVDYATPDGYPDGYAFVCKACEREDSECRCALNFRDALVNAGLASELHRPRQAEYDPFDWAEYDPFGWEVSA